MFGRLLVGAALAATLAMAQPPITGGGGDMGGDMGGRSAGRGRNSGDMGAMGDMGMRRAPQSKTDLIADKLKLNKDQKEEFDKILSAGREEARPIQENLLKMRAQLAAAVVQGAGDADMKKAMDDYTAAAAQLTGVETKAYGKLYALLKPNQQGKAAQAFELMAGIFDQRVGGGRGMSWGRGQGQGR